MKNRRLWLIFILFCLGLSDLSFSKTVSPPDYSKTLILPMLRPDNLDDWLLKSDALPVEPFFNAPVVPFGTLMVSCENPDFRHIVLGTTICFKTNSVSAPDSRLGPITDQNRLTLIKYFALRFGIQTDPLFFRPQFFDPKYIPPLVLAAGAANGPSVLNAYSGCIRLRIYELEKAVQVSSPTSLNGYFNSPFTVLSKQTILKSTQLGVLAELVSAQRLAKLFDYMFPDAYAWEMLLTSTGKQSKCGM